MDDVFRVVARLASWDSDPACMTEDEALAAHRALQQMGKERLWPILENEHLAEMLAGDYPLWRARRWAGVAYSQLVRRIVASVAGDQLIPGYTYDGRRCFRRPNQPLDRWLLAGKKEGEYRWCAEAEHLREEVRQVLEPLPV